MGRSFRSDPEVSAIVLAGGKSSRLGRDKRALRLTSERTQLEETVQRVAAVSAQIVVAVDASPESYAWLGATVVVDERPEAGPLGGLCAGLAAIQTDYAVVVACDLPFLSSAVLRLLLDRSNGQDLVVPRHADGPLEMLQAVYRKTCLPHARRRLAADRLKLADLVPDLLAAGLAVRLVDEAELAVVDPELRSFFNVNTPGDLRRAQELSVGDALVPPVSPDDGEVE